MNFRKQIFKIASVSMAVFTFLWWPLSHWFYSDKYHSLLGFSFGSYQNSMVKMIGTCGLLPVMVLLYLAVNPEGKRPLILLFSLFSLLLGLTFLYLISLGFFPKKEFFNVFLSITVSILYPYFYHLSYD